MEGMYHVKNDTYGFATYLVICDREDFQELSRKAPLKLNAEDAKNLLESVDPSTAGFTITLTCSNNVDAYLIWLPTYDNTIDDLVTLAHEVSHVAFFALKHRGWSGFEDTDKQHSQMYLKDTIFRSFLMKLDAEYQKTTKKKKRK